MKRSANKSTPVYQKRAKVSQKGEGAKRVRFALPAKPMTASIAATTATTEVKEPNDSKKLELERDRDALHKQIQSSQVFWDEQINFVERAIKNSTSADERATLTERLSHLHAQCTEFMNHLEGKHKSLSIECIKSDVGKFKALYPLLKEKPFALKALQEFVKLLE
jgi:hypothetical protein